jgi:ABC-2 type transport system permease protein
MAVYKRNYRPYDGDYTPLKWRFLVIPRFAITTLFESRALLSFYFATFLPAVAAAGFIYLVNSETAQALIGLKGQTFLVVDGFFFMKYLVVQAFFCFLLTAWVGPGLVSVDFANDALPLFLSRPFSRADYLAGKFTVVASLLSTITFVPALILFALQSSLAGWTWLAKNLWIAGSIVLGSMLWITVLTMLVLAVSAWVRWKIAATALMAVIFFVVPGFGEVFNEVLRTYWGKLLNLSYLIGLIWADLFHVPINNAAAAAVHPRFNDVPVWSAWLVLALVTGLSLWMLNKRLRAREVVR